VPDKFIVPQFIDNEDKILGPVTVRQFVLGLAGCFALFLEFRILTLPFFIFAAIITVGAVGLFGFVKINGQPFHIFFLNAVQTLMRPAIRVWDKAYTDAEIRVLLKPPETPPAPPKSTHKAHPGSTRLRDLSLTVNTGGVYVPES
jgi:hypothetical protein